MPAFLVEWLPLGSLLTGIAALITAIVLVARVRAEIEKTFGERDKAKKEAALAEEQRYESLQRQLGTATEAEGKLREELQRLHDKDDGLEQQVIALSRQLAAANETIASQSEINAQLMVERREFVNEKAVLQKKLILSEEEKSRLLVEMTQLRKQMETLTGKVENVEHATGEFKKATQELKNK